MNKRLITFGTPKTKIRLGKNQLSLLRYFRDWEGHTPALFVANRHMGLGLAGSVMHHHPGSVWYVMSSAKFDVIGSLERCRERGLVIIESYFGLSARRPWPDDCIFLSELGKQVVASYDDEYPAPETKLRRRIEL